MHGMTCEPCDTCIVEGRELCLGVLRQQGQCYQGTGWRVALSRVQYLMTSNEMKVTVCQCAHCTQYKGISSTFQCGDYGLWRAFSLWHS